MRRTLIADPQEAPLCELDHEIATSLNVVRVAVEPRHRALLRLDLGGGPDPRDLVVSFEVFGSDLHHAFDRDAVPACEASLDPELRPPERNPAARDREEGAES